MTGHCVALAAAARAAGLFAAWIAGTGQYEEESGQ